MTDQTPEELDNETEIDDGPREASTDHRSGADDGTGAGASGYASGGAVASLGPGLTWQFPIIIDPSSLIFRYTTGANDPPPRTAVVPTTTTTEAVQAWKVARLAAVGNSLVLRAMHRNLEHPIEGDAKCLRDNASMWSLVYNGLTQKSGFQHLDLTTPELGCTCGFYAWKDRVGASAYIAEQQGVGVLMQVELFGKVIEHEKGYRAKKQRVLGVELHGHCNGFLCHNHPRFLQFHKNGALTTWCDDHKRGKRLASVADIANELQCEVRWAA